MSTSPTIILTGPTASGKTALAIEAAMELRGQSAQGDGGTSTSNASSHQPQLEIINADSVCFYQEFNIGSAKPTPEELKLVPHHLIDVAHPNENYHAGKFLKDCEQKLSEIHARGNRAIIVGGSGFYLKALRLGLWEAPPTDEKFREEMRAIDTPTLFERLVKLDPLHAQKIGANDRYRIIRALEIIETGSGKTPTQLEKEMPSQPDPRFQLWVIDRDKAVLEDRMRVRIAQMLDQGWIEETQTLIQKYPQSKTLGAVGYQQIVDHLNGVQPEGRIKKPGLPGLIDEIVLSHRQLAKQQRTWFKNMKPDQLFQLEKDRINLKEKLMTLYQK